MVICLQLYLSFWRIKQTCSVASLCEFVINDLCVRLMINLNKISYGNILMCDYKNKSIKYKNMLYIMIGARYREYLLFNIQTENIIKC